MPSGTAAAEWSIPARFFVLVNELPKCKVARVLFVVFVCVDTLASTGNISCEADPREFSVVGKRGDTIIDRSVRFVGLAVFKQRLDDIDHFADVMRRPRRDLGPFHAECVKVFPKRGYIRRRE